MTDQAPDHAHVIPLRPRAGRREATPRAQPTPGTQPTHRAQPTPGTQPTHRAQPTPPRQPTPRPEAASPRPLPTAPAPREPLWRDLVGDVLRRERLAQERTLKDVAEAARISMPYLSEVERGRKEASSEVLAAAAQALGLGLGDLLSRAQGELGRVTARRAGANRAMSRSPHNGLCLAA